MKILALDTATNSFDVALIDNGKLIACDGGVRARTHTRHLMGAIHKTLEDAGLAISAIDGFAVTTGPGSFTGLRIGIATAKGLATAMEKPLVGVSTLRALANRINEQDIAIWAAIDARKGQVYTARFRQTGSELIRETKEIAQDPEKWASDINEESIFIGDGAILYSQVLAQKAGDKAMFAPQDLNIISAQSVAGLAWEKFKKGQINSAASLKARYIRKFF